MLTTIIVFLLTLSLLVGVHEAGHYFAARWSGVKVLRFSIGFGKPLFSWTNKDHTEFAVAPIPLGGYVRMLDERDPECKPEDRARAHGQQSPLVRIWIAFAGPFANFLFAIVVFGLIAVLGQSVARPWVSPLADVSAWQGAPNEQAMIISVDDRSVHDWRDVHLALLQRLGHTGDIRLELETDSGQRFVATHAIERWQSRVQDPDPISVLGLSFWRPQLPPVLGEVMANQPAALAGLREGDRMVSVNGTEVDSWQGWVTLIQASPEQPVELIYERQNRRLTTTLIPASVTLENGDVIGRVGVAAQPFASDRYFTTVRHNPIAAVWVGIEQTWQTIELTLGFIGKMITGQASVQNLSGPVSIAQVAGDSAGFGLVPFLSFLALLSVSLGILNLLPVPVLDGGHILYYLVEWVRGRPLSDRAQTIGVQIGIALLIGVMVVAFTNDFYRLF
jgi:regulator of sigma E protease